MREADNKSIFLSVVSVYVVRTSSLNDKHSCQLFRKAASFSSLVLLSSSVSTANQALFLVVIYFLIFASYPQSSAFLSSVFQSLKLCLL